MTALGEFTDDLSRRTNDTQHTTIGIDLGDIILLYGAQSLRRGGVTAKDDEMATHLKELQHSLARELIDHLETARSIRRTGIVAQIKIIVLGKQLADAVQDGQASIAAVEDANGARKR